MATRVKRTIQRSADSDYITIDEAFREFIEEKETLGRAEATIRSYCDTYKLFMTYYSFDDNTTIDELDKHKFFQWVNDMSNRGVKHTSINHYLRDMRTFCYWCMSEERRYIEEPFKMEMRKGQDTGYKMFNDEEIAILTEKPRRSDNFITWRTWAIVNWVLATGNRASTITFIRIGDIDFKNREISIVEHTKNKKAQIIPLSSSLETVIKEYIRIWRKNAPKNAYLFCNIGEEYMTTNALRHSFSRYCKARGVNRTNIHGLRHTFALNWIRNGGDTFALQKILGHSSLDMTKNYVKLSTSDLQKDFDRFNPLDNIKKSAKRTQSVRRGYDW